MNADRIPSIQVPLISMPGWVVRGYVDSGDVLVQYVETGSFFRGDVFFAAMSLADIGRNRFRDGPVAFEVMEADGDSNEYGFRISIDPRDWPERQLDQKFTAEAVKEIMTAIASVRDKTDDLYKCLAAKRHLTAPRPNGGNGQSHGENIRT